MMPEVDPATLRRAVAEAIAANVASGAISADDVVTVHLDQSYGGEVYELIAGEALGPDLADPSDRSADGVIDPDEN